MSVNPWVISAYKTTTKSSIHVIFSSKIVSFEFRECKKDWPIGAQCGKLAQQATPKIDQNLISICNDKRENEFLFYLFSPLKES